MFEAKYETPVGSLRICASEKGITLMRFSDDFESLGQSNKYIEDAKAQLDEYFEGKRKSFDLSYDVSGTDFQMRVWEGLLDIPYGETRSYSGVARMIKHRNAARAVGNANNKNPLWLVVPCHRVIAADGSVGGYGGSEWRKEWLLNHEQKYK